MPEDPLESALRASADLSAFDTSSVLVQLDRVANLLQQEAASGQGRRLLLDLGAVATTIPLQGPLTIGREAPADLVIPTARMSARHCCIERKRDGWCVEDLQSTNGTRVNGELVTTHLLREGDAIEAGGITFVYIAE